VAESQSENHWLLGKGRAKFFSVFGVGEFFGQAGRASLPAFLSANAPPGHWRIINLVKS